MGDNFGLASLFYTQPSENAGDVWTQVPTNTGVVLYSVLTPMICLCGIVGNLVCLLVLTKKEFVCSFYVYLRVITVVDLAACAVTIVSGLARGALWWRDGWAAYDALISVPLGGFLSCLSTIATVSLTIDRLIYLKNPLRCSKPKCCTPKMATKVMCCGTLISILCTVPFCFIFEFTEDGALETTSFYQSRFYLFYSWFDLTLFAILPSALLITANLMLILSIKNARRLQKKCQLLRRPRKIRDQSKITATLIIIIFFHLIGELPTHLTARKTAANILYGGDDQKADCSMTLENFRQATTVLNALHLAMKFMLYCYFCPPFYRALKATVVGKPAKEKRIEATNVPVKVFLVEKGNLDKNFKMDLSDENFKMDLSDKTFKIDLSDKKFKIDLSELGFMNIFINTKAAQEFPRLL